MDHWCKVGSAGLLWWHWIECFWGCCNRSGWTGGSVVGLLLMYTVTSNSVLGIFSPRLLCIKGPAVQPPSTQTCRWVLIAGFLGWWCWTQIWRNNPWICPWVVDVLQDIVQSYVDCIFHQPINPLCKLQGVQQGASYVFQLSQHQFLKGCHDTDVVGLAL